MRRTSILRAIATTLVENDDSVEGIPFVGKSRCLHVLCNRLGIENSSLLRGSDV